jgi:hypothetical protein
VDERPQNPIGARRAVALRVLSRGFENGAVVDQIGTDGRGSRTCRT